MVSRSLTLSFPFDGLDLCVHSIEWGHFNFAQRGLYYFGLAVAGTVSYFHILVFTKRENSN